MPPLSPRPSRDPRVLTTGRENLRILVMAVLGVMVLAGFFFFQGIVKRKNADRPLEGPTAAELEESENRRLQRTAATEALGELRKKLDEKFEGVDRVKENFRPEQDQLLAELASLMGRLGAPTMRWAERVPTPRLFSEEPPSERRGEFLEVHGTLLGDTWSRPVGGVPTVLGLIRPELELGKLGDQPVAFIARFLSDASGIQKPAEPGSMWADGTWVRVQGLYVCDFFLWNRLPDGATAPLLVAGELNLSEPSLPLRGDLTQDQLNASLEYHDAHFPTRHNDRQYVRTELPVAVPDDIFLTFAQLALVHRDEPFSEDTELLFKEMLNRFYDDPQAERGKLFKIQGELARVEEVPISSNPFRIERKQFLFIGGRYGWLWVDSPQIFDVKVGDVVEIEGYFASRIWYHGHNGDLDRPYFVARAVRPFVPAVSPGADFWSIYLPGFLCFSAVFLFGFFFIVLFRDRKRSEAAQAKLIEMRRRRRHGRSSEQVPEA